jgi:hypothetical protein
MLQLDVVAKVPNALFGFVRGIAEFREDLALGIGVKALRLLQYKRTTSTTVPPHDELQEFVRWLFQTNLAQKEYPPRDFLARTAQLAAAATGNDGEFFMEYMQWVLSLDECTNLADAVLQIAETALGFTAGELDSMLPADHGHVTWRIKERALIKAHWFHDLAKRIGNIRHARQAAECIFAIEPSVASYD